MATVSPPPGGAETSRAFHELLDVLRELEERFTLPDRPIDEHAVLEGYPWIFSILAVGLDAFVWADTDRPRFVDIVGPYRKWGGDNSDAHYLYAPIDPARTYRVRGTRGDAVYLSLTVYGGPTDGHYSDRIVGTVNDQMLTFDEDGRFEFVLSPTEPPPGTHSAWLRLDEDAVAAITREYHPALTTTESRAHWTIEADDPAARFQRTDVDLARRFRAVATWLRDQAAIVPVVLDQQNVVQDPYPVPEVTVGWAAGDAAYAMGAFELEPDQALVLRGRSPECRFWNLCLWNPFLHTYNYDYESVTINVEQVAYEDDGSWVLVVADRDPGHPNWVSTAGHPRGLLWFRWFYPAATPDPISAEVVPVDQVPAGPR